MKQYLKKLVNRSAYTTFRGSSDYITPNVSLCATENEMYYNPYVDPYNGHAYVEIGGVKWATMNVGANSVTDTGLYFQWGDTQGYTAAQVGEVGDGLGLKYFDGDNYIYYDDNSNDDDNYTKYNSTDNLTTLQAADDAVTAAWGSNWRMPTVSEFVALYEAVTNVWTDDYQGSGVAGLICTDKTDSSKVLFFPACGEAYYDGMHYMDKGIYWSSSLGPAYDLYSYAFWTEDGSVDPEVIPERYLGYPIRGIFAEN